MDEPVSPGSREHLKRVAEHEAQVTRLKGNFTLPTEL